jgi:DNA-binding transcriptional LysR family regulator
MELTELRCFVTLAEQLHYGRAAGRMYISQSALSKSIAGLERELGVVLFERTRHATFLNEAADRLLDAAFVRYIRADLRLPVVELRREPTAVAAYAAHPYFVRQSLNLPWSRRPRHRWFRPGCVASR